MYLTSPIAVWIVATALLQAPATNSRAAADEGELSRLENVWNEAHTRGDADALDKLWADDLIVTVPNMRVMTKPDTIGMLRSGKMRFERYQTSEIRIRVYEDAAVVTGRLQRPRDFNGRSVDDDWRFTKMYLRRSGR